MDLTEARDPATVDYGAVSIFYTNFVLTDIQSAFVSGWLGGPTGKQRNAKWDGEIESSTRSSINRGTWGLGRTLSA